MAIAFRAPEISTSVTAPPNHQNQGSNQIPHHPYQPYYHGGAFVAVQGPPSPTGGGGGGSLVILSPLSAVIQHHQTAWLQTTVAAATPPRTQPSVTQQQMVSGFPPISPNNMVFGGAPAVVRGVPLCQHPRVVVSASPPPQPHPHYRSHQRCVTAAAGPCAACNDTRRVYLLLSLMLSSLVYSALKEL